MSPHNQEDYDRLRALLKIDWLRVDQEVAGMAQLIQETAEYSIRASEEEAAAKSVLEIVTAEASARLRIPVDPKEKPKSDAQIGRELPLERDVQEAQISVVTAHTDAALWRALVNSMQDKSQILRKGCNLIVAGFITPTSYSPRRAELMKK
jgi:hypothetical protein